MKDAFFLPTLGVLCFALTANVVASEAPSLTIYNQDFAVVREQVSLPLKKGVNELSFSEITAQLEPSSVILRDPSGKIALQILEQNYRNDPVSQDLLLAHFEGKEIDFQVQRGEKVEIVKGRIVRAPSLVGGQRGGGMGGAPIIEVDGRLQFQLPGVPLFPALADDSILKPTLHWKLSSNEEVERPLELSYLSGGFSWSADYNLVLPEKGNDLTMVGWITLNNQSGRTFSDAQVKLMAGDVSRIQPEAMGMRRDRAMPMAASLAQEAVVTEKAFDEYHLYTLARPATVRDQETKQVEFIRAEGVKSRLIYVYNGAGIDWRQFRGYSPEALRDDRSFGTQSSKKVRVYREFANTKENQLGIPLPKGRIRFYRSDEGGQLEFIGENEVDHTPRNEELKIYTGDAFDIVGERIRTNYELDTGRKTLNESFTIKVRNRKDSEVEVKIVEDLYRGASWEITEASDKWEKVDSQQITFLVKVPADSEKVVTYTVRYTW